MLSLIASLVIGFLSVLIATPYARKYLLSSGIYGIDQQKQEKPKLPTSGGLVVLFGFMFSVTSFIALNKFLGSSQLDVAASMAALNSIIIISIIGLIDDIHIDLESFYSDHTGKKVELDLLGNYQPSRTALLLEKLPYIEDTPNQSEGEMHRLGLPQVYKMLFVLPAVLPLMAVGVGSWSMNFPLIGTVNWGIIYPLVLLPLGLLFVSNVVNMLAGTNGLSTGMSLVAALGLGIFALLNNRTEAAVISLGLASCLIAFYYYNHYPASILPGDSLTYLSGAALFSAMVIGNMEKFGVFIFAPWFLEFFLKLRSGFKARSWGVLQEDGSLNPQHSKNYSLTHPLMRRGLNEKQITLSLIVMEVIVVAVSLILFRFGPL